MGEECGSQAPFLYFTDHRDPALAQAVREGRQREFGFDENTLQSTRRQLPDPNDAATYAASYPWTDSADAAPWHDYYQALQIGRASGRGGGGRYVENCGDA